MCEEEHLYESMNEAESMDRRHGTGRKGKLFSFNKENYEKLKENDSFRLEF